MDMFDKGKFEDGLKEMDIEYDPSAFKVGWFTRLMFKFWPFLGVKLINRRLGVKNEIFEVAQELFSKAKFVDVFPTNSRYSRGFILVLNRDAAFFFDQDGDHFKYDGFEMGKYEKGDITIFDNVKTDHSLYDL